MQENKEKKVVKKRGRPKKNRDLDFSIKGKYNINSDNIYPPANIANTKKLEIIKDTTDLLAYLRCNNKTVFEVLIDSFKGNENEINIIFTPTGLLFSQPYKDNQKDMVRYEAKILPDKLISYKMISEKNVAFQMNLKKLYDIVRTIPKDVEFEFRLHEFQSKRYFRVIYNLELSGNETDYLVTLGTFIGYDPIECKSTPEYDVIFMMESTEFERVCKKTLKPFAEMIDITYEKKQKSVVSFNCVSDNTDIKSSFKSGKKFKFLKGSQKNIVSGRFNLSSFLKYTKCHKFSTITKIYLSNVKPLIIEFDISPGLGTLQVFVQSQNYL
jgi:hypothetical protein